MQVKLYYLVRTSVEVIDKELLPFFFFYIIHISTNSLFFHAYDNWRTSA